MKRRLLKLLARVWLALCVAIAALWLAEALDLRLRVRVWGPWSFQVSDNWGGKISLIVFHDFPSPVIGPQLDPGNQWNAAALTWANQQPRDVYRTVSGFDRDDHANIEINSKRNMLILGRMIMLRMPDWAACVMWLPLAGPVFNWWKRRREFARGIVWSAATICARRPSAAANAAGQRKAEL